MTYPEPRVQKLLEEIHAAIRSLSTLPVSYYVREDATNYEITARIVSRYQRFAVSRAALAGLDPKTFERFKKGMASSFIANWATQHRGQVTERDIILHLEEPPGGHV